MSMTSGSPSVGKPQAIGFVPRAGRVPPNGATAQSPVLVAAGATDDHTITGMILYVDGVRKFSITNNSHFDKKVSLQIGSHRLTVKAWDTAGRIISKTEYIYVQ